MALDDAALRQSISDPKHKGFVGEAFGRYEILSHLAKGGMGAVYRARHKELGQMVALKLLLRDDPSSEAVGRFKREAKVLASIKHPHIVGISDLGEDAGVNYIAMELIDGRNLHQIVRAPGGELPEFEWTAEVISHVARALAHCHEQGVIHRDVKPHNIIVEHGTGRAVLTDFGLVKRDPSKQLSGGSSGGDASQVQSQAGALLGTPSFMSPEQFEPDGDFGSVEARTDVWGLGATLFFLLTGRPPFQGSNVVDLYHGVTTQPVPRATTLRASVPVALDDLCARMLTKEVAKRPTMAEVVLELEKLEGSLSRATSSRGLRHTAVLLLLLVIAVGVDVAWLHPARGRRIARLFTPQEQLILDEPEPQPVDVTPPEPSAFEATAVRAGQGELAAMVKLGLMLKAGSGCTADPVKAFEWFEKAGDGGDEGGMFWAGYCLARGVGVAKDDVKAREWFKRCAGEAHPIGMYWLGTFLAAGRGGPTDASGARDWFVKARDLGDAELKKKAIEQLSALRQAHPELQ